MPHAPPRYVPRGARALVSSGESDVGPWDAAAAAPVPRTDSNNGIEATRRLKAFAPDIPVVMLVVLECAPLILQAIGAGANGYLLKKAGTRDMICQHFTASVRAVPY